MQTYLGEHQPGNPVANAEYEMRKAFLKEMTREHEGWDENIYPDTEGNPTIGYGFNLKDPLVRKLLPKEVVSGKRPLKKEEALGVYDALYARAELDAKNYAGESWDMIPLDVQGSLTDMSYNLGGPKLEGFVNMKKALQNYDYPGVAKEMVNSKWYKQVGDRSKNLVNIVGAY